jgi:Na+/H+ antiporter NhaD/arsenite permease-like protein
VLTFLTGLSIMFLIGRTTQTDKEQTEILEYIRQIEFDTLLFFLGILLLVGMLKEVGVLTSVAQLYAEFDPKYSNYVAGSLSALLDNVPLTAALLKASPVLSTPDWLALTYAVGVGGSLLSIGSAAGIIMMSKMKNVTFGSYLRYTPMLLVAYSVGYVITLVLANRFYGS